MIDKINWDNIEEIVEKLLTDPTARENLQKEYQKFLREQEASGKLQPEVQESLDKIFKSIRKNVG